MKLTDRVNASLAVGQLRVELEGNAILSLCTFLKRKVGFGTILERLDHKFLTSVILWPRTTRIKCQVAIIQVVRLELFLAGWVLDEPAVPGQRGEC